MLYINDVSDGFIYIKLVNIIAFHVSEGHRPAGTGHFSCYYGDQGLKASCFGAGMKPTTVDLSTPVITAGYFTSI